MEQSTQPTDQTLYTPEDLAYLLRIIMVKLDRIESDRAFSICQEYLRVPDVAKLLAVSEPTVRKFINEGKLRASKPGAHYIIPASSIREFLVDCQVR